MHHLPQLLAGGDTGFRGPRHHDARGAKGDVLVCPTNWDKAVFDDVFRVDLARTPSKHLSFGQSGPHVCPGMWLARLKVQVEVQFEEFARHATSIERTAPN